jgi:hypothetical protein
MSDESDFRARETAEPQLPLVVDVMWVTNDAAAVPPIAEAIFRELSGDPDGKDRTRTGIPVFFRRLDPDSSTALDASTWVPAERRALVLLADAALGGALTKFRSRVRNAVDNLIEHIESDGWLVLIVALESSVLDHGALSGKLNIVRAYDEPDESRTSFITSAVALELHRLFAEPRVVRVFISYANADGGDIAAGMKRYLDSDTHLDTFLDSSDIYPGEKFADVLDASVIQGPVVAVLTDRYAASVWCGREILLAKRKEQPVVVIDAITVGYDRSFPYLGNGPVVRWQPGDPSATYRKVVELAIRDSLRRTYFPLRAKHLVALAGVISPERVLACPPELMTLIGHGSASTAIVYPDPPVPSIELALLREAFPEVQLRTPSEVWS